MSSPLKFCSSCCLDFPDGSGGKESACNAGDLGSIPRLGRSLGRGPGSSLQYSCLENPCEPRSLMGYSPCGRKEPDMTEWLSTALCLYDHFFHFPLTGKDKVYVSCCVFFGHSSWHAEPPWPGEVQTCAPAVDRGPTRKLTVCYLLFDFWEHVGLYNSQVTVIKCILNGCPYLSCW